MSKRRISVRELVLFPMLGSLMFISKVIMEALPNIHLLGMLVMIYTLAFRVRALIPIYIYVFLNGLFAGFDVWWLPYLYIWAVLWAVTMLLPRRMPKVVKCVVYPLVCCLHGLLFGTLYAPAQAILFGLDLRQTIAWIISGIPFDLIHAFGNLAAGMLILPLSELMLRLLKKDISVRE
ncbi:MAG: hypothetical protein IKT60_02605 [Clostridia bacterium]|nr:hypothetical protein [Clostridia bacterium]